jgi:Zn-dependent alcohol dehydrogenase
MKAAVLEQLNSDLSIKDVELTNLKRGQVLVKVLVSGICGSQLHEIKGNKGNGNFLPHLMGHEGCGIVEALGEGVTTVKVGDKVVMHWRKGSGIEAEFPQYILDDKTISSGKVTTLSEYSIVSENRLTTVPANTPNNLAAMLGCSLTTAFGTIDNECDLNHTQIVTVIGCGGVGLNLIQAAKIKGAFVVAVDINPEKQQLAFDMGADSFFVQSELKSDVIIDTTGSTKIINNYFKLLSDGGKFILVGQPNPEESLTLDNALSFFDGEGKTIKATQGGKSNPEYDILKYISLFQNTKLDYSKVITHEFELDEINEAFSLLKTGKAGRIMIKINER